MRILKVVYAILLFLCLAPMPYGYYQLIRFLGMMLFGVLAVINFKEKKSTEAIIYLGLAILFQPLFKIALGRTIWNIVDVTVGVWLLWSVRKRQ